jgi:hypothetical protein
MNPLAFDPLALLDNPTLLFGNFTYLLMGLSVLMRNIVWLRALAITGGVAKIAYRTYFVYDPVSVFWEALFVVINLVQLCIIWWENRPPNFTAEEQHFVDTVAQGLTPAAARALLQSGVWQDVEGGTRLTVAGERVNALLFISQGRVRIESAGAIVGTCASGDFLGEMTFANGNAATATAITSEPVRLLSFERQALERVQAARPVLRLALQASFNRNLIDKLVRANQAPVTRAS